MFGIKKPSSPVIQRSQPSNQALHVTGEFRVGSNVRVGPHGPHSPTQGSCISPTGRKTPTTGRKTPNRVHFSDTTETFSSGKTQGNSNSRRVVTSSNHDYYTEEEKITTTKQLSPRIVSSSNGTVYMTNGGCESFPARLSPQPHSFHTYNGGGNSHRPLSSPVIVVDLGNGRKEPQRASSVSPQPCSVHYDYRYDTNHNVPVKEERIVDIRTKSTHRESAPMGYRVVDHTRHTRRKKVTLTVLVLKLELKQEAQKGEHIYKCSIRWVLYLVKDRRELERFFPHTAWPGKTKAIMCKGMMISTQNITTPSLFLDL